MKHLIVLSLALAVLLSLAACTDQPAPPADTSDPADTSGPLPAETTETPTETTAEPEPAVLAEIELPSYYETRMVRPTSVTPEIDGVLTEEEWGTPDLYMNAQITEKKRTYCRDTYGGAGNHVADITYYWRYDDKYVYAALEIREPAEYVTSAPVTKTGDSRTLHVQLGDAFGKILPGENGEFLTLGNAVCGYTSENGVQYFEAALPRESVIGSVGDSLGFIGYIEFTVTVDYIRHDDLPGTRADVITRTTPVYQNEEFTHDVFLLEKGTPAPAPDLGLTPEAKLVGNTVDMGNFTLTFSEPTVLEQGPADDQIWGHYQFPSLTRFTDGSIRAGWSYGRDTILPSNDKNPKGYNYATSYDNGESWTFGGSVSGCSTKNLMKNGKYFTGFAGATAYATDYLDKYEPGFTWGSGYRMFYAEDIIETKDTAVKAYEYDPETGKTTSFSVTVNWPHMPLVQWPDKVVYPVTKMFALSNRCVISVDGDLYIALYFYGFDSFAETREESVKDYCRYYSVFILKSEDNGRTWNLISQIMTDEKITGASEGVCEPEMEVMPDGSFVMLMRTGSSNPSWIVRSTDRGVTWSDPEQFDYIGVLPQLLTLECGVTLASYGRPTMRFAATDDPAGETWRKFDFPVTGGAGQSCFYTDLLALNDHTALFIYSDFQYPNEDGEPVKTVLVRKVTVTFD